MEVPFNFPQIGLEWIELFLLKQETAIPYLPLDLPPLFQSYCLKLRILEIWKIMTYPQFTGILVAAFAG